MDPGECCPIPAIRHHHFLNSTLADFELCGAKVVAEAYEDVALVPLRRRLPSESSPIVVQNTIAKSPRPLIHLQEFDPSLLEYYVVRLCPLATSSCSSPSPLANLLLPLFTEPGQEDVIRSLMALSARHRSAVDPHWAQIAMRLKGRVLTDLRRRLNHPGGTAVVAADSHILLIMMFLCLYEIFDNGDHRWVIHLRASQEISRRRRKMLELAHLPTRGDGNDLVALAERFFAFQDSISSTACGDYPLFGVEYWENHEHNTQVDAWMGCSPELAGILCDITQLGREKMTGTGDAATILERAEMLKERIQTLADRTESWDDADLASSAELKRLSAFLYLQCVLYDACPFTPQVSDLVRDILTRIHAFLRAGRAKSLAFPVFVAAVELDPTDDMLVEDSSTGETIHGRRLVLEALDSMSRDSLSNVSRTGAVIQKVWKLRDMHLGGNHLRENGSTQSSHLNDWATFVGPNSAFVSLT